MGRPTDCTTPQRFSPYKRRSPLGVISKKFNSVVSSAIAFSTGLRRSFTKILHSKIDKSTFASMPVEVLFQFFDILPASDLVKISTLTRAHFENTTAYLNSQHFAKRLQIYLGSNTANGNFSPFAFAKLIRICNLFQANKVQSCANYITELYLKVESHLNPEHDNDYWGKLISATFHDWSQTQFFYFMQIFSELTGLRTRVDRLFDSTDETKQKQAEEIAVRRLLRSLFLDNISNANSSAFTGPAQELNFRLSALLHFFSSQEALNHTLMLLLGAPINLNVQLGQQQPGQPPPANLPAEFIDYQRIFAEPITDYQTAQTFLGELPCFIEQLLATNKIEVEELRWNELEVFNFMEMLTTYPEPWVLRNFACLLVMAPRLARVAVYIRALHGDPMEAGNTLFSCVEASFLIGANANLVLRDTLDALVGKCSASACLTVLREAVTTTYQLTMETLDMGNNNNNGNGGALGLVNADAVDIITLKIALEVNRKVSDLFLTHLNQFNF